MAHYRSSRLLPTILTIIVIIIAIAGLVALARLLFTGGGSQSSAPSQIDVARQNLLNSSDGRAVSMTVRGPIVAEEDFRSYRITISPSARTFESFKGYLDVVVDKQTLSNNTAAYNQLVNALNKANLVAGAPFTADKNDTLGICATGKVYEFRLLNGNDETQMYWTSTCGGSTGSLRANIGQTSQLFLNQIPNGSKIESTLKL